MNVTAQYPATAAMNSPTRARAPRDFEDAAFRAKQARFDNHDDFYSFLDNNRGPGGMNTGAQMSPQQQPRRMPDGHHSAPEDQSRPPVTNVFVPQRSVSNRSRPPSYNGSRSEELLVDRKGDRGDDGHKVARQNGRRAARPTTSAGQLKDSPTRADRDSPQRQEARPTSSGSLNPQAAGASIQRLKSPSVMSCVLQPLEKKVTEYNSLMRQEQDEMSRLDAEIRALQDQRAKAEMRYLDAKNKHDDYHRQYSDVERAMRGEPPIQREPPPPQHQQQHQQQPRPGMQRPMSVRDEEDDYEEEDFDEPPPIQRRMSSQQSFGRASQKGGFGARFRNSFFGGR